MTASIPYLKQGDKIALLSTARKIETAELQAAIDLATSWGLELVIGKTIGAAHFQMAGDDNLRLNDFQQALNDDSIKAIWCARGGYGTVRIIDEIDFRKFQKKPKWICGFSDITVLHSHVQALFGIPTIHALMPVNMNNATDKTLQAAETLHQALFGKKLKYQFDAHPLNRMGDAKAEIVGGNLSLIHTMAATQSDLDTSGKILVLEDVDEYLYHIDRMLLQLKRSGKLNNLAALAIGGFTDMKDNAVPFGKTAEEIIIEHVAEFDYPVCFNFPIGHQSNNKTVKLGCMAHLQLTTLHTKFEQ